MPYIDEVEIYTKIDLQHAGDTVMQARRQGNMKYFQSPEFYVKRCDNMKEKVQQWTINKATEEDLQWWGDEMQVNDHWSTPMKQNIRVLFANLGGLSHENNFLTLIY